MPWEWGIRERSYGVEISKFILPLKSARDQQPNQCYIIDRWDSIFDAAERYFAEIEAMVTPIEFNWFFSFKDLHAHLVTFGGY